MRGITLRLALVGAGAGLAGGTSLAGEAERAIDVSGGVTVIGQRSTSDGYDPSVTTSLDLFLGLPQRTGRFELYVEGNGSPHGLATALPDVNADAGTALDGNGRGRLQVSEAKYDFHLEGGRALAVGLLDLSAYLDTTRVNNDENLQFVSAAFVNNPVIELPDYTLGGVFRQPSTARRPRLHFALASSAGLADSPERSYSEMLDVDDADEGLFGAIESGWTTGRRLYRLGLWAHRGAHDELDASGGDRGNFGAWGAAGAVFGTSTLNLRLGWSDPEVSPAAGFASFAYQREMGRRVLGAALAGVAASRELVAAEDSAHAEVYLSIRVAPGLYVTPSVQRVWNSGFAATARADRITVVGLRLHRAFDRSAR